MHSSKNFNQKFSSDDNKNKKRFLPRWPFYLLLTLIFFILAFSLVRGYKAHQKKELKIYTQINQKFDHYRDALANAITYACTKKLADEQRLILSDIFYQKEKQSYAQYTIAQQDLYSTLKQAKDTFGGNVGREADKIIQEDTAMETPTANTVTRGYCQNFEKESPGKIQTNLNQYQIVSHTKQAVPKKNNAIYLNSNFQITKLTNDLEKQTLPSTLFVNDKAYTLHCRYQNVQYYEHAIATNNPIAEDIAYKASENFYQQYSPQINHILICQTEVPLSEKPIIQRSDTYPWYQPTATGSNESASGDAMVYLDKNQLAIIIGHEPCACNYQSEQNCNQLKSITRGFKQQAWKFIDTSEQEKARHNQQAQIAITSYLTWLKNEMKKDFCFIKGAELKQGMITMFDQVKQAEPNGPEHPNN